MVMAYLFFFVLGEDNEEPERILPDDFYYDFDDLVSKAFSTEGIPPALLSFQYPFNNHRHYIQCIWVVGHGQS